MNLGTYTGNHIFVCRLKDNAKYEAQEVIFEQELSENVAGVMKTEHIHLQYKRG
jgi:hypothetical protein